MDWWRPDLVWPVVGAIVAGGVIGFEREFRARAAGFRTHTLVALTAALLMLAAQHQVEWAGNTTPEDVLRIDPVRMAHGILTGIGFLCGGVIFKEGFSVKGLTTAASLWITSAIGCLFGVGFFGLAVGGTVATLGVLIGLRMLDARLPQQYLADSRIRFVRDRAPDLAELKAILAEFSIEPMHVTWLLVDGGRQVEYCFIAKAHSVLDLEGLTRRLLADGRAVEYRFEPRTS